MATMGVDTSGSSAIYTSINEANQSAAAAKKFTKAASGAGSGGKADSASAAMNQQDTFLKLLTTQLKNQDPLNPMDNAQMTSQMAQISTVDGITKLNATLQHMLSNTSDSQTMQAAAMVGRVVLVPGKNLTLSGGKAAGGVELDNAADQVTVSIKDANGLVVRTLELGAQEAGATNFTWDGTTESGATAADGQYTISLAAKQGTNKVTGTVLEYGAVSSVTKGSQGITLTVGKQDTIASLADVKQIL